MIGDCCLQFTEKNEGGNDYLEPGGGGGGPST